MKKKFKSVHALLLVALVLVLVVGTLSGCGSLGEKLLGPLDGNFDLDGELAFDGLLDGLDFNKENSTKREIMDVPDLAEYAQARTVTITAEGAGVGSGFFVDDQGTVVTCYHVIDGATSISVRANDEASYEIQSIIDFDEIHDIAVLKLDISNNDYFNICQVDIRTGENVYAIGSSLGELDGTFSNGIVSTVSRKIGQINCVQTTAPISSGNSGGPLLNAYGEVIGINAFSYTDGENLNLAVDIDTLERLSMDKHWSISQFKEWYDKETHRSYFIYSALERSYQRSTVHTYQTVTGQSCLISADGWDDDGVEGYVEGYDVYFYEYNMEDFDTYTEYLNTIGFEYQTREEYNGGTSYYYLNEFTSCVADILVFADYIAISFASV